MKQIGFIGCGNMGGAILLGALQSGALKKEQVLVYDVSPVVMQKMAQQGVRLAKGNVALCQQCDMVFLAVKPQYAQ